MKKFLTFGLALAMIIPCVFMATGCSGLGGGILGGGIFGGGAPSPSSISEGYYKWSDAQIEFENDFFKEKCEEEYGVSYKDDFNHMMETFYGSFIFKFNLDSSGKGTVKTYEEENGYKVPTGESYYVEYVDGYLYVWEDRYKDDFNSYFKVEGNNIMLIDTYNGQTSKIIFTKI